MTSKEKNTKKNEEFQLEDLLEIDSENLLAEILKDEAIIPKKIRLNHFFTRVEYW